MTLPLNTESAKHLITKTVNQGVAVFSPADVPVAVGAPGAGSGLAGISTVFDEPLQPETAKPEAKPAMAIHVKRYRFICPKHSCHKVKTHLQACRPA